MAEERVPRRIAAIPIAGDVGGKSRFIVAYVGGMPARPEPCILKADGRDA